MSESAKPVRHRVLVVDDDAALSEMLQLVLRSEGFDTRLCHSGDRALAAFRDYRPDLVPSRKSTTTRASCACR